jgi:hypothetical protein
MSASPEAAPKLSVVVVVHAMRRQAMNTLHSLSVGYQRGVRAEDYEVVVVENRSAENLDPAEVEALPGRFRYSLRDEPGVSPAAAINAGLALARGEVVGLMIDGARLVSPGVLELVLMAGRMDAGAVVAVPGYQIGPTMQHLDPAHDEAADRALLAQAGWPASGYGVFRVSSMSWANQGGWLRPFMECNCLFAPRAILRDGGDADERFDLPGGGALNLHMWRRAVLHARARLVVLPGEGSFHQAHGGVSTTSRPDREAMLDKIRQQLDEIAGEPFAAPDVAPLLLGAIPPEAAPFLLFSAERFGRWSGKVRGPHLVEASFETARAAVRRRGPDRDPERGAASDAPRPAAASSDATRPTHPDANRATGAPGAAPHERTTP